MKPVEHRSLQTQFLDVPSEYCTGMFIHMFMDLGRVFCTRTVELFMHVYNEIFLVFVWFFQNREENALHFRRRKKCFSWDFMFLLANALILAVYKLQVFEYCLNHSFGNNIIVPNTPRLKNICPCFMYEKIFWYCCLKIPLFVNGNASFHFLGQVNDTVFKFPIWFPYVLCLSILKPFNVYQSITCFIPFL